MPDTSKQPRGFIALMSAGIISAVLLVVVLSGSLSGMYSRFAVLDMELKARSAAAADACAAQALLMVAHNPQYEGAFVKVFTGLDTCRAAVALTNGQKSLTVQATSGRAVTNLEILVAIDDVEVISWKEKAF